MLSVIVWIKGLGAEEQGQGIVEYALILILISMVSIAAVSLIGPALIPGSR